MNPLILKISSAAFALFLSVAAYAQTTGTMTFKFTPTSHTGYSGTRNVLAIWIQTSSGTFVKTRSRNAGSGTNDHLPTWAVNSGGPSTNCLSASCNMIGATSGATLSTFTTKNITWDGTDVTGAVVADGTYKITVQSTWNHGGTGTTTRSFTFVKGPNSDVQAPANDANFTNMTLYWNPASAAGVEENTLALATIYPNPSSDGFFNVDYVNATEIKVVNLVGMTIMEEKLDSQSGTKSIDLSSFTNGIYLVSVSNGTKTSEYKIVLDK